MKKCSLFITAIILTILLVSCNKTVEGGDKSTDVASGVNDAQETVVPTAIDSLEARKYVSDNLPEADFGGEDFTVLYQDTMEQDIDIFDASGDVINDAVYARNIIVAERFKVNIKAQNGSDYQAFSKTVGNTVRSGDASFDLCMNHIVQTGADVLNGYYHNINDVKYIDITKPWYPKYAIEATILNDRQYALVTDACFSSLWNTYTCYFNKQIV